MILRTIAVTRDFSDIEKVALLAKEAFPPEEYLSPDTMIEMSKEDDFDFWALYDEDTFVGFMAVKTHKNMSYLFFLAIDPSLRSKGYGSRAVETLKVLYEGYEQVVDFEMLDETASNNEQRQKRRLFYLRNAYCPTGYGLSYRGVAYEIMCSETDFEIDHFRELMSTIMLDSFNPRYFRI